MQCILIHNLARSPHRQNLGRQLEEKVTALEKEAQARSKEMEKLQVGEFWNSLTVFFFLSSTVLFLRPFPAELDGWSDIFDNEAVFVGKQ